MDSSTVERWLRVAFYGMAVLSKPSFCGANTTSTRSAVTKAATVDPGRRADESPPDVCPRQVQFGEEKPSVHGHVQNDNREDAAGGQYSHGDEKHGQVCADRDK